MSDAGSVKIEDGFAVIRVPLGDVHALRVALAECPCKSPKSNSTAKIRKRIATALGRLKK